jgi:hypothetical protein
VLTYVEIGSALLKQRLDGLEPVEILNIWRCEAGGRWLHQVELREGDSAEVAGMD